MTGDSAVFLAAADGGSGSRLRFILTNAYGTLEYRPYSGPAFSADGGRLAFVANQEPLQGVWLRIITANGDGSGAAFESSTGENAEPCGKQVSALSWASTVGWAPDGSALAFLCEANAPALLIHQFASGGGSVLWVGPAGVHAARAPITFSPDGRWVLYGDGLYDAASPTAQPTELGILDGGNGIGWAPNGWIIVGPATICGTGVYWMAPVHGAPQVKLLGAPYRYASFSPDGKRLLALTSVCGPGDTPRADILNAPTLSVEATIPGAVWAAWRP